jgi:hypothetical protein
VFTKFTQVPAPAPHIAVLMTCHNRRDRTIAALAALRSQTGPSADAAVTVHLVDTGGDGTAAAVRAAFPNTDVVVEGPDVYWGTGTAIAASRAAPTAHVLWLNDDVVLAASALATLLATAAPLDRPTIVVGAMRSGDSTRTTYSTYRVVKTHLRRPALERVEPDAALPTPSDTCNGNAVLVTAAARRMLGDLDPSFPHQMGDLDYGLRARRAGIPVLLAPGHLGICDDHPPHPVGTSREPGIGPRTALRRLVSVRELPPGPWWLYCRRHFGPWAPLIFWSPYVKTTLRSAAHTKTWGPLRPQRRRALRHPTDG